MGDISLSFLMSTVEQLGENNLFQVKNYLIEQKHTNYTIPTSDGVNAWTTLFPVTVITLNGVFTDLVELVNFIATTKASAAKTASNNVFHIKEDDVSKFPDTGGNGVLIDSFRVLSNVDISANRWDCVLVLTVDE